MSKEKAKGCVRPYRGETDREVLRELLAALYKRTGHDVGYFLGELELPEEQRVAFPVALVHESPGGVVDGAVLGSESLNVVPMVDPKAVKPRARLGVLLALLESVEAGILVKPTPNVNVFPSPTALKLTKGLTENGFIFCDWFFRSPLARELRRKLM